MRAIPEIRFRSNQVHPTNSGVEGILVAEVVDAGKYTILFIYVPIGADVQELRMLHGRRRSELRGRNADGLKGCLVCRADRNWNRKRTVQMLVCSEDEKFVFLDGTSGIHAVGIHQQVGLRQ